MYKVHIKRTIFVAVLGLAIALTVAFFSKTVYEGRLEMLLGSNLPQRSAGFIFDDEVKEILSRNKAQGLTTERQLLMSQTVFREALNVVDSTQMKEWEDLFLMYDVVSARTANQNQIGAGVVQIRVRAYSEDDAREIADEIAVAYNIERRKVANAAVGEAISYISTQMESTEIDLKLTEQAVQDFMSANLVPVIDRSAINETDFRGSLVQSREALYSEISGLNDRIGALEAQIAATVPEIPDTSSRVRNPQIDVLERDIIALEGQLAALNVRYTSQHHLVRQTDEALLTARAQLVAEKEKEDVPGSTFTRKNPVLITLETELSLAYSSRAGVEGRLESIIDSLEAQDAVLEALPALEITFAQLQRDRAIFDEKYRRLKAQMAELENRLETGAPTSPTLGEGAIALKDPVAPDHVKFLFIGFIAGACVGLVMSFALESMRPRVYTSSQLGELTGLPVVASIPSLSGVSRSRAVEGLAASGSSAMESFRNMAYSYLATRAEGSQSVMFTGIGTAGSSSIGAAQFAVALAHAGRKVVLVDAERTRQVITNGFDANDMKGVSDAIQQGSDVVSMLTDTEHENLRLLPIGTVPEALMSEAGLDRIEAVMAALCGVADVVVIAVAPTDVVADAAAFASKVDEVCLCVSARANNYGDVPMAFDIMEKSGAKTVKLILTDTSKDGEPFAAGTSIQRAD